MNNQDTSPSSGGTYNLRQIFEPSSDSDINIVLQSKHFARVSWELADKSTFILDKFSDIEGASCCFVRLPSSKSRTIQFKVDGGYELSSCHSGGWLLKAIDSSSASYWIPQMPTLRDVDSEGRILAEQTASIVEFKTTPNDFAIEVKVPKGMKVDMALWRFQPVSSNNVMAELQKPLVLEKQAVFFWTSETTYQSPADLYLYLVNGEVYTNRFIWPRNWKICSELDAYGLYVTLSGLESATDKVLYDLLKRQILISVIARQAEDGAWYHGEWTRFMESHYRLHNGAMLLMEDALTERSDDVVRKSLERAAHFISQKTDMTDLGLWYMHDSLEDSDEMMEEMCRVNGSNWIQEPILGKSKTNKLIFNTHVDCLIALEHYRQVTGDLQYEEQVSSACDATRGMLALRPADFIYRLVYRAINLTLLPTKEAVKLPLFLRAIKRLTWKYLTPNLYRIKNKYPRIVMPNGLIERHLGMGHYDVNYHPVNIMDIARFWRCFPDEKLAEVINGAIQAVENSSLLDFWAERESRHKSLVEWVDALYHLCTIKQDGLYRRLLAEGVMKLQQEGIGVPPSILGGDFEAINISQRSACPSPTNEHLRVVNLSCGERMEILVINATSSSIDLVWEGNRSYALSWENADGLRVSSEDKQLQISEHSWIWGKGDN